MANLYWLGTTNGNAGTAANWSTGSAPVNGDSVTIDARSTQAINAGLTSLAAVTLAKLTIVQGSPAIGTNAAYLEVSATILDVNVPPSDGSRPAGASLIAIDTKTVATTFTNYAGPNAGSNGLEPVIWKGVNASNVVRVRGGTVGIATLLPGDMATLPTLELLNDTNLNVHVGTGVTLTTITQTAGNALVESAFATLNQDAGTLTTRGTGAVTTMYVRGLVNSNSTGTVTTLNIAAGGVVDFTGNTAARTVTTCNNRGIVLAGLPITTGAGHPITFTNGVDLLDGGVIDPGSDITVTLSAV